MVRGGPIGWEERILARLDHRPLSDVARVGSLQPKFSFSGVVAVYMLLVVHWMCTLCANFTWSVYVEFFNMEFLFLVNLYMKC
jgi:hypothetical protein